MECRFQKHKKLLLNPFANSAPSKIFNKCKQYRWGELLGDCLTIPKGIPQSVVPGPEGDITTGEENVHCIVAGMWRGDWGRVLGPGSVSFKKYPFPVGNLQCGGGLGRPSFSDGGASGGGPVFCSQKPYNPLKGGGGGRGEGGDMGPQNFGQ